MDNFDKLFNRDSLRKWFSDQRSQLWPQFTDYLKTAIRFKEDIEIGFTMKLSSPSEDETYPSRKLQILENF